MGLRRLVDGVTLRTPGGERTLAVLSEHGELVDEVDFTFIEDSSKSYRLQVVAEYVVSNPERVLLLLAAWVQTGPETHVLAIGAAEFESSPEG